MRRVRYRLLPRACRRNEKLAVAKSSAPTNRRGSAEAIAKRRAARALNDILDPSPAPQDGRTENRRKRLIAELKSGKTRGSGKPLKPIDVLFHVTELFELGETPTSLNKVRPRPAPAPDAKLLGALASVHKAYGFPKEAYAFLSIPEDVLKRAKEVTLKKARSGSTPTAPRRIDRVRRPPKA